MDFLKEVVSYSSTGPRASVTDRKENGMQTTPQSQLIGQHPLIDRVQRLIRRADVPIVPSSP